MSFQNEERRPGPKSPKSLPSTGLPFLRIEISALLIVPALFILLRLPLLRNSAVLLGWNSDSAIFGLMARAIRDGNQFPLFFWGQRYMGPLTPWSAVLAGLVTGSVDPRALRTGAAGLVLCGIVFYWLALRNTFSRQVAIVVALWLAIGPRFLYQLVIAPNGAEAAFFLSGIIFWHCTRTMLERSRDWLVFGVLAGFGWWINQSTVLTVAGVVLICILRSKTWRAVRASSNPLDRLLLRFERLDFRQPGPTARTLLRALNYLLQLILLNGLLFIFFQVPAFFFNSPIGEPLAALLVFHIAVTLVLDRSTKASIRSLLRGRTALWNAAMFATGCVIGYSPVIAGWLNGADDGRYGLGTSGLNLSELARHLVEIRYDFWMFIGADTSIIAGLTVVCILVLTIARHRLRIFDLLSLRATAYGPRSIAAAAILLSLVFYAVSQRAHAGSVRYIIASLPLVLAFAAEEMLRRPALAFVAGLAFTFGLMVPRLEQTRDVVAARSENHDNDTGNRARPVGSNFDPRPVLQDIERQGYQVCFADYWIAYKLEWLSEQRVRFIPLRSQDRTPLRSKQLNDTVTRKCVVDAQGNVKLYSPSELEGSVSITARQRLHRLGGDELTTRPKL